MVLGAAAIGLALAPLPGAVAIAVAGLACAALLAIGAAPLALLACVAALAGAAAGEARLHAIDRPGAELAPGDRVAGRAVLLAPPRPGQFGSSVELRMSGGAASGARLYARLPREARLSEDAGAGTELRVSGFIRAAPPARTGEFDFAAYLHRRGVAGELAVERVSVTGGARGGLAGLVDGWRRRAERGIAAGMSPAAGALARGMVLGQDEAIDPTVREDFRASGLAHVLAVSGQNVMLLAALALPLLAATGLPPPARIAATIGLIAVYVPVAGAEPSLQRAAVMGVASLVALAASRPTSRWYALLLAACATLAVNPRATGEPGWQLSFAAVVGILALGRPLRVALAGLPRALADGVAITVAATLATAPLLAHHFGTVSLASLPANVLALALVAPIMWLGMLRAALGQVAPGHGALADLAGGLSALLGHVLEPLLGLLARLAAGFAELPGARLALPLDAAPAVLAAYGVLAAAVLAAISLWSRTDAPRQAAAARGRRARLRRRVAAVAALAAIAALVLARGLAAPAGPTQLTVSFLDVGQGDATLIQHPDGTAVLFDGGPPEGRVARLLRRSGVRRLSLLVLTHPSRDHHGGLAEVVERYPIDLLLDGGDGTADRDFRAVVAAARARGIRRVVATAPLALRAGGLSIRVLSPPPRPPGPPPEDPNPRAVAAVVSAGDFDLFLSADAESDALEALPLPDVEAMKVSHHGSADPGLPQLLDRLRPEVAGIPVGEDNGYGHPTPSTLAALREAGVAVWRTDEDGTVRLTVTPTRLEVRAEHGQAVSIAP
jgi:competence protein ComEC